MSSQTIFLIVVFMTAIPLQRGLTQTPRVSLVSVIANGEGYSGKVLVVDGCVSIGFERNAVFLSRFDFDHLIFTNAVRLVFEQGDFEKYSELDGTVCRVHGTFEANEGFAPFAGIIKVTGISELPPRTK